MVWLWANAAITFAVTTWETYHTGVMVLPEINGPNEGLSGLYLMHAATALIGQDRRAAQGGALRDAEGGSRGASRA